MMTKGGPPREQRATLGAALARAAKDQDEDAETVADFAVQASKPTCYATYRDWMARQTTVVAAAGVMGSGVYVSIIHAVTQWDAWGRASDEHDGAFIAAVGDRSGAQDPPWVEVRAENFYWKECHLLKATGNNSAVVTFYTDHANCLKLFDAGGEAKETAGMWVPRHPMLPMKVAAIAVKKAITPWELFLELHEFANGRAGDVAGALVHVKNWALMATCQGAAARVSKMSMSLTPLTMPSKRLQRALGVKLNMTLGARENATLARPNARPDTMVQQSMALAQRAMDSVLAAPTRDADEYQRGIMNAMQTHTDNLLEPGHKNFTDMQKVTLKVSARSRGGRRCPRCGRTSKSARTTRTCGAS